MISGIYKITNPAGEVYIGQSFDIAKRWRSYERLTCVSQPKIYSSLLKYGSENHSFEIIYECDVEELNKWERHYIKHFNSERSGLNATGGGYNKQTIESRIKKEKLKMNIEFFFYSLRVGDIRDVSELVSEDYYNYFLSIASRYKSFNAQGWRIKLNDDQRQLYKIQEPPLPKRIIEMRLLRKKLR